MDDKFSHHPIHFHMQTCTKGTMINEFHAHVEVKTLQGIRNLDSLLPKSSTKIEIKIRTKPWNTRKPIQTRFTKFQTVPSPPRLAFLNSIAERERAERGREGGRERERGALANSRHLSRLLEYIRHFLCIREFPTRSHFPLKPYFPIPFAAQQLTLS